MSIKYKPMKIKWLRDLVSKIVIKFNIRNRMLNAFAFPCEHTHTFKHYLPINTIWFYKGEKKGMHDGLLIEGCYLCGKIKARDYKA
jgi:hypothetical protein